MKKRMLNLYSGLVGNGISTGLSKVATTEQTALGINNKVQKCEPFIMTDSTEITQVGTLTKPSQRLTIGKNTDGVAKTDLQEYVTLQEVSELNTVIENLNKAKDVVGSNTSIALTDPMLITWFNAGSNGTLSMPSTADIPVGAIKYFTIYNRTPKTGGTGLNGFLGVTTGDLVGGTPTHIIIPHETSMTFYAIRNGIWTSQHNRHVYRTTLNTEMDIGLGDKFFIDYNANNANTVALGITLAGASYTVMPFGVACSMIIRNANSQAGKYVVSMPTGSLHYKGAASYDISQGKAREFSVMKPLGSGNYYWQVSEELSNA